MSDLYLINGLVYLDRQFVPMTLRLSGGKLHLLPPDAPLGLSLIHI